MLLCLQVDSKVDFVVDSVLLFSEALDRFHADREAGLVHAPVNSYKFFWDYIMRAEFNGAEKKQSVPNAHLVVYTGCHFLRLGNFTKNYR